MDMRTPPLQIEILLESNPPKSRILVLVRRLAALGDADVRECGTRRRAQAGARGEGEDALGAQAWPSQEGTHEQKGRGTEADRDMYACGHGAWRCPAQPEQAARRGQLPCACRWHALGERGQGPQWAKRGRRARAREAALSAKRARSAAMRSRRGPERKESRARSVPGVSGPPDIQLRLPRGTSQPSLTNEIGTPDPN